VDGQLGASARQGSAHGQLDPLTTGACCCVWTGGEVGGVSWVGDWELDAPDPVLAPPPAGDTVVAVVPVEVAACPGSARLR
jgi:hypothetical protein